MKKLLLYLLPLFASGYSFSQQIDRSQLNTEINTNFYTNTQKKITGDMLNDILKKISASAWITLTDGTPIVFPSNYTVTVAATDTFLMRKTSDGLFYKVPASSITVSSNTYVSPLVLSSGTVTINSAAADGSTKGAASFNANDFNSSSGNISIDYTNGQAASGSTKGFLTSTDWTTFNGKQDALVSGTNIKTVNSTSLLGSGNVSVEPVISAGTTSDYWRGDKTWQSFNSAARSAISLTTTGTSGAATYNSGTGVLNVPNYSAVSSQWTTTGNDIYNSNTGNVGIGNSSPDAKLDVVSTSTVNPVASFSVNTSGSTNATGVNINAEGGTTTDALVVNSKSNVSGGINNAIVALATTANGGYNNPLTSIAQNGDYNYGAKVIAQGGVDAVGLSISASGASGNNNAIDITAGNFKYTPGSEGAGKVLTSDANGVASWQTPSGGGGVTTAVAPLSISSSTISIQSPTSGTVLRANGTSWTNSTYSVSNTFTANSILHATSTNTVGENTSFGFNGNQMYMGTTTPSANHGIDFRWNNNAATYWRFYNPSTGTSSQDILRLYNQSYVLDLGINGINFTNSGLLRASTPFILFNAPTNENGLIYTSSTNGLIFAIGGSSASNAKMYLDGTNGFVGIGTGTVAATARLHVIGSGSTTATESFKVLNTNNDTIFKIRDDGKLFYKDGNQANGKVLTSNAIGMATWTTPSSGSVSSVDISGGTTGLTFSGGPITTAGTFTTSGTLSRANGGTGETTANAAFNALSPNTTRGDITVRNATVNARLALGAAGTILRSDGTDLAYSTATYPNTTTANQILHSTSTNNIGGSANLTYDGTTFATPVASHSTSLTSPLIIGGSGTTQSLTYKTTTGVGTTGADHIFSSGNNGATEIARMTNAGAFLVGKTAPTVGEIVAFKKDYTGATLCVGENTNSSGAVTYRLIGNQKTVELGLYNSAHSNYGMIAANDAYMYGNANYSFMAEGASAVIKWSTGSSTLEKMRLDANGNLGIGTSSPQSKLDVEGGAAIGATYSGTTAAPTNGLTVQGSVGIGTATVATTNKVQIESTGGGASTTHTGVQYTGTQSGASSILYGIRSDVSGGQQTYAVRGNNTNTQASSNNKGARFTATGVGGTSNKGVEANASGATTNIGLEVTSSTNTDYGIQIFSEDYALVTNGSAKVGIGTTTPTELFQVSGTATVSITSDGKIIQNGLTTYDQLVSLADDGTFDIPAGTTGWCEVIAGVSSTIDGAIAFRFTNDGAVLETRVADAIASATTDTDTKLCAFDNGTNVRIKNRLGGTRDLLIKLTYR